MPLLVFRRHLGEDSARGKVGAVGFDAEGLGRVRRDENRSGGDALLQPSESGSLDQGGHRGFGGSDPSRIKILLQKGVQLFLFGGGKRIDFAAFWRGVWSEFDGVIPRLGSR